MSANDYAKDVIRYRQEHERLVSTMPNQPIIEFPSLKRIGNMLRASVALDEECHPYLQIFGETMDPQNALKLGQWLVDQFQGGVR